MQFEFKRPDLFALVLDDKLTLREAAKEAGLIKDNSGWAAAVAKLLTGFKQLDGDGQIELLDLLWSRMELIDRHQFMATHRTPE